MVISVIKGVIPLSHIAIQQVLPLEARKILIRSLEGVDDFDFLPLLRKPEQVMNDYARSSITPCGVVLSSDGLAYRMKCQEFEESLRKVLIDIGSRIDLTSFTPTPLIDPKTHDNLGDRAEASGISVVFGCCDSVLIDGWGTARATKSKTIRLIAGNISMDLQDTGEKRFHILRFIASECPQGTMVRLAAFRKMLNLLFYTVPLVTGKGGSVNDQSIFMADGGKWRFKHEKSVWGFEITRLEKLWLTMGAIPARLIHDPKNPLLYLLREDEALELARFRRESEPEQSSPWAYLSNHGIYSKETVINLAF